MEQKKLVCYQEFSNKTRAKKSINKIVVDNVTLRKCLRWNHCFQSKFDFSFLFDDRHQSMQLLTIKKTIVEQLLKNWHRPVK